MYLIHVHVLDSRCGWTKVGKNEKKLGEEVLFLPKENAGPFDRLFVSDKASSLSFSSITAHRELIFPNWTLDVMVVIEEKESQHDRVYKGVMVI